MPRYIFANVGRGNIFRQIRAFSVVKSLGKSFGRRGWCEIGESDGRVNEPYRMRLSFPKRKWKTFFVDTHTPITLPIWQKCIPKKLFAVKGKSGAFPTKHWTYAIFPDEMVVMWNGHLPPGAFNAKQDSHEEYRKEAWYQMWEKMEDRVATQVEDGWSQVIMCDANRQTDMPKPHKNAVLCVRHKTDYMWAVPAAGSKLVRGQSGTKELKIDFHRAIWADIDFKPIKN